MRALRLREHGAVAGACSGMSWSARLRSRDSCSESEFWDFRVNIFIIMIYKVVDFKLRIHILRPPTNKRGTLTSC